MGTSSAERLGGQACTVEWLDLCGMSCEVWRPAADWMGQKTATPGVLPSVQMKSDQPRSCALSKFARHEASQQSAKCVLQSPVISCS
eukprot:1574319-Amphidinium_carterae.1